MKKTCALILAVAICCAAALPCLALDDPDFVQAAGEAKGPLAYLTDPVPVEGAPDLIACRLLLANVEGLTGADIAVQYKPYQLRYEKFESAEAMNDLDIVLTYSSPTPETDADAGSMHEVRTDFLHLHEFDASRRNCEVCTITFRVLAGGEFPLELNVPALYISEKKETVKTRSATVVTAGEQASEWDYAENQPQELTVPSLIDGQSYHVVDPNVQDYLRPSGYGENTPDLPTDGQETALSETGAIGDAAETAVSRGGGMLIVLIVAGALLLAGGTVAIVLVCLRAGRKKSG